MHQTVDLGRIGLRTGHGEAILDRIDQTLLHVPILASSRRRRSAACFP
jgi:hypothetical protein